MLSARTLISGLTILGLLACDDSPAAPTIVSLVPTLAKTPSDGPYAGVFADGAGDKLRSDGAGAYLQSDPNCTTSWGYRGTGLYQLRTIQNTGVCKARLRGTWRYFTIDLGAGVVDLDQDGVAEAIELAPGRLMASGALGVRATSSPITIFIFKVLPDGSTTEDAAWTLTFNAPVPVSGSGVRVLQALPGNAGAIITNAAGVSITVDLPFKLTLSPQ
jgi:hypothetical protein